MRSFRHIAKLIRSKRLSHPKGYSQSELSHILGYKNGQFISNVERALCNIPLKMLSKVSDVLDIPKEELKAVILKDHEETLENFLHSPSGSVNDSAKANSTATSEDPKDTPPEVPFAQTSPFNHNN